MLGINAGGHLQRCVSARIGVWQVRYLDLPDRQDLRKLQQLREEQGELSAADERRLKTLQVGRRKTAGSVRL